MSSSDSLPMLAILVGAVTGGALFLLVIALRGLPSRPKKQGPGALERQVRELFSVRGGIALVAGILVLVATGWIVAGVGVALLVYSWRSLGGAASERKTMARLESLGLDELLDVASVAEVLGFGGSDALDDLVSPHGYRLLARIPRIPMPVVDSLIEHFGGLQKLLAAGVDELNQVDGVGAAYARSVREGLSRLAESSVLERYV